MSPHWKRVKKGWRRAVNPPGLQKESERKSCINECINVVGLLSWKHGVDLCFHLNKL